MAGGSSSPTWRPKDCRAVFDDDAGVTLRAEDGVGPNLHPAATGRSSSAVFKVSAANVITSMRIEADGLRKTGEDALRLSVSRSAGIHWSPVWQADTTGRQQVRLKLRDEVAGVTQCLVKVEMSAAKNTQDVGLDNLRITTVTQLNRRTLPALTLGTNQVMLFADQQVETTEIWPALHAGAYKQTAAAEADAFSDKEPDGMYKATLGAGADGKECSVTWRLAVPTDITDVTYGAVSTNRSPQSYVSLQHSWDGRRFSEFDRNSGGGFPFDKQVIHAFAGGDVPAGARQASFRGVFFCKNGAATYNMPGIQDLLIRVHHKPRDAGFRPMEVTCHWTEHRDTGDVSRSHTELVAALPHRYAINVAGKRDPTMNWVRINLQGYGPEGKSGERQEPPLRVFRRHRRRPGLRVSEGRLPLGKAARRREALYRQPAFQHQLGQSGLRRPRIDQRHRYRARPTMPRAARSSRRRPSGTPASRSRW